MLKYALLLNILFFCSSISAQFEITKPEIDKGNPFIMPFTSENAIKIPYSYVNGFIILNAKINQSKSIKLIFDTGSETSIITDTELVDELKIPRGRLVEVYGADRSFKLPAQILPFVTLDIGNLQFESFPMLLLLNDFFDKSAEIGVETHGIIGADLLRRFIIMINPVEQTITFKKKLPEKRILRQYTPIPCEYVKGRFFPSLNIKENNQSRTENFLLDSGSNQALVYHVDSTSNNIPENLIPTTVSKGLGGDIKGFLGLASTLDLVAAKNFNIPVQYQVLPVSDSIIQLRNGIIGNPILMQYLCILDYGKGDVYLKKNKHYGKEIKRDKSGIILIASGKNLNKFTIQQIIPNSPAERVGLQKGDEIVSLKGINKSLFSLNDIHHNFRKRNGKKIRLKIKREGEILKYEFRLEDYLAKKFK